MNIDEHPSLEYRLAAYGRLLDDPSAIAMPIANTREQQRPKLMFVAIAVALTATAFGITHVASTTSRTTNVTAIGAATDSSMAFPVAGNSSFVDTWGASRMAGTNYVHTQQGIDIFAPVGTPVRAMRGGLVAQLGVSLLGGNKLWITDDDGNRYFYAQLHRFASKLRNGDEVATGQIIGYVGGGLPANPATTPAHLHVEVHVAGAFPVNPFPILRSLESGVIRVSSPRPRKILVRHRFGHRGVEIVGGATNGVNGDVWAAAMPLFKLSDQSMSPPDFTATSYVWTTSIEELRQKHCSDDVYGVYLLPTIKCSLPIPIPSPNNSLMQGSVVAFTDNKGRPIRSSSPMYRWLTNHTKNANTHAAQLGFVNLDARDPAEWHSFGPTSTEKKNSGVEESSGKR